MTTSGGTTGSCHCGSFSVALETELAPQQFQPRMCGCSFCRKHRTAWFADPAGRLTLECKAEPQRYRFGSETADFITCPNCGVVVAAVSGVDGKDYGILNLNCLDTDHRWPEPDALSNFDGESTGDRLARRAQNWMQATLIVLD